MYNFQNKMIGELVKYSEFTKKYREDILRIIDDLHRHFNIKLPFDRCAYVLFKSHIV